MMWLWGVEKTQLLISVLWLSITLSPSLLKTFKAQVNHPKAMYSTSPNPLKQNQNILSVRHEWGSVCIEQHLRASPQAGIPAEPQTTALNFLSSRPTGCKRARKNHSSQR